MAESTRKALCLGCQQYFVTWDAQMPHGCRLFSFKGREMPCHTVFKNSGQSCQSFSPKSTKANNSSSSADNTHNK